MAVVVEAAMSMMTYYYCCW